MFSPAGHFPPVARCQVAEKTLDGVDAAKELVGMWTLVSIMLEPDGKKADFYWSQSARGSMLKIAGQELQKKTRSCTREHRLLRHVLGERDRLKIGGHHG